MKSLREKLQEFGGFSPVDARIFEQTESGPPKELEAIRRYEFDAGKIREEGSRIHYKDAVFQLSYILIGDHKPPGEDSAFKVELRREGHPGLDLQFLGFKSRSCNHYVDADEMLTHITYTYLGGEVIMEGVE